MSHGKLARVSDALFGTRRVLDLLPGLLLAVALTSGAHLLSGQVERMMSGKSSPFSPILLAVLLGLTVRNTVRLPAAFAAGVSFGVKKLLRLGIILMGIRLSVVAVLRIGVFAVGLVAVCIATALALTALLTRGTGISGKLGALIAAGTSICGVSAIVATAPAIEASEEETAYAIGTITLFGMLATLTYPYLVEWLLRFDVVQAGFFLGAAIHDTSQVTGASLIYDQLWGHRAQGGLTGSEIAITTKLVRNTFLVAVVPLLGYWSTRGGKTPGSAGKAVRERVPLFVAGYVLLALLRTVGDLIWGAAHPAWAAAHTMVGRLAAWVIAAAITCVGLNTELRKMTGLGWKPLLVGLAAALSVGAVSGALVALSGGLLRF